MFENVRITCTQITELAGYTSRVSEMLHVFEEVDRGRYEVISVAEDLVGKKDKDGELSTMYSNMECCCNLASFPGPAFQYCEKVRELASSPGSLPL